LSEEADESVFVRELRDDRNLQDEVLLDYFEKEPAGDSRRLLGRISFIIFLFGKRE